jgi:hypothetical protein
LVGAVRQYEVFIAGTPLWNRYYSAQYSAPYSQMSNGGNLSNALDTNEATDNGFGAQWDLGGDHDAADHPLPAVVLGYGVDAGVRRRRERRL